MWRVCTRFLFFKIGPIGGLQLFFGLGPNSSSSRLEHIGTLSVLRGSRGGVMHQIIACQQMPSCRALLFFWLGLNIILKELGYVGTLLVLRKSRAGVLHQIIACQHRPSWRASMFFHLGLYLLVRGWTMWGPSRFREGPRVEVCTTFLLVKISLVEGFIVFFAGSQCFS